MSPNYVDREWWARELQAAAEFSPTVSAQRCSALVPNAQRLAASLPKTNAIRALANLLVAQLIHNRPVSALRTLDQLASEVEWELEQRPAANHSAFITALVFAAVVVVAILLTCYLIIYAN